MPSDPQGREPPSSPVRRRKRIFRATLRGAGVVYGALFLGGLWKLWTTSGYFRPLLLIEVLALSSMAIVAALALLLDPPWLRGNKLSPGLLTDTIVYLSLFFPFGPFLAPIFPVLLRVRQRILPPGRAGRAWLSCLFYAVVAASYYIFLYVCWTMDHATPVVLAAVALTAFLGTRGRARRLVTSVALAAAFVYLVRRSSGGWLGGGKPLLALVILACAGIVLLERAGVLRLRSSCSPLAQSLFLGICAASLPLPFFVWTSQTRLVEDLGKQKGVMVLPVFGGGEKAFPVLGRYDNRYLREGCRENELLFAGVDGRSDAAWRIDLAGPPKAERLPFGGVRAGFAVDCERDRIYALENENSRVVEYSIQEDRLLRAHATERRFPSEIVYEPSSGDLFFSMDDGAVSRWSTSAMAPVKTIETRFVTHLLLTAEHLFLANDGWVTACDRENLDKKLENRICRSAFQGLALDPVRDLVYMTSMYEGKLFALFPGDLSVARELQLPIGLKHVAYDDKRDLIAVLNFLHGDLLLVDAKEWRLVGQVFLGRRARGIFISERSGKYYVTSSAGGFIIDPEAVLSDSSSRGSRTAGSG